MIFPQSQPKHQVPIFFPFLVITHYEFTNAKACPGMCITNVRR